MKIDRLESPTPDAGVVTEAAESLLDRLDSELMKRGTLTADTIDWQGVRSDAVAVLKDCLHLQAIRAVVFALCQNASERELAEVQIVARAAFLPDRWVLFHPQGPKAERRRKQWGLDILTALHQALKQVDFAGRGLPQELLAHANEIATEASVVGLEVQSYKAALAELRQRSQVQAPAAKAIAESSSVSSDAPAELDAKGRAELRRDLRALAERISRSEPGAEVAFLMRRYAAWLEFKTLPPVDSQGRVEQQPMPANIADEFRAAVDRPSDTVLMRLEDRLFNSPDWFEGQHLAARIAQALGYASVAAVIHERVAKRLGDLPALAQLRYANDAPFLDPATAEWARAATTRNVPALADEPKEAASTQELTLKDRISALEENMTARRSRRTRAVAKLSLAQELGSAGLSAHAQILLQELSETLSEPLLASWDSEFADEVRSALSRVGN